MRKFWQRKPRVTCPVCKGKRGWNVPAHVNYGVWGLVPAYWRPCWKCNRKGSAQPPTWE